MILGASPSDDDIKFLCYFINSSVDIKETEDLFLEVDGLRYETIEQIAQKLLEMNGEEATPDKIKAFKNARKAHSTKVPVERTALCVLNYFGLVKDMVLKASLKNKEYINKVTQEIFESKFDPDFFLLNVCAGKIVSIAPVEGMDKIYHEQVSMDREYSICSGLREHYSSDDLLGNTFLFVANGKKAKFKGVVSEGMILCAKDGNRVEAFKNSAIPGTRITLEGQMPIFTSLVPASVDLGKPSYQAIINKFKVQENHLTFNGIKVCCGGEYIKSGVVNGTVS